ncbi:MAG: type II toxin-antitoxin system HicB family antitoxin [Verrucomicrobiae bacterium]|nr:type II toxin-antitoxin system HicB family antitoxin [Verrucomicrobiae bacterium]
MRTGEITYWQDGEVWLGFLDEYPDYFTQGSTFEELKENLLDVRKELTGGAIPCVRRHAEIELA